jgi:hypothetical protein
MLIENLLTICILEPFFQKWQIRTIYNSSSSIQYTSKSKKEKGLSQITVEGYHYGDAQEPFK